MSSYQAPVSARFSPAQMDCLLSITQAIATVQDQHELLRLILEQVKPVFDCYDFGLLTFDQDGETMIDWTTTYPHIDPSEHNLHAHHNQLTQWAYRDSPVQTAVAEYDRTGQPVFFEFTPATLAQWGHVPIIAMEYEKGYKELLFAPLRVRGKLIGGFNINALRQGQFAHLDRRLFQAVTDQIALAVDNILSREQLLARDREKTALLGISEAIATVQRREQLLDVVYKAIRPAFVFDSVEIFYVSDALGTYQPTGDYHTFLLNDPDSDVAQHPDPAYWCGPFYTPGSAVEPFIGANGPLVVDFVAHSAQYPPHVHTPMMLEAGIRSLLNVPLRNGDKQIGIVCFLSTDPDRFGSVDFPFARALADQLAVAVSNILANEDILQREREKSLLLSISADIVAARNATELLSAIREKAQQLIPFHDTGILIVEPDGQHHYDLSVTIPDWDASEGNQQLAQMGLNRIEHPGSVVEVVMRWIDEANEPILLTWEMLWKGFEHPFFETSKQFGYHETMVAPLRQGGRMFATLWLNSIYAGCFHKGQFQLFQALADQVATAVANMLANEELAQREREKSLLLSLSEDMTTIRDRQDLLEVMLRKVKPVIGYDDAVVSTYSTDLSTYTHFLTASPPERKQHPLYAQIVGAALPLTHTPDDYIRRHLVAHPLLQWTTAAILEAYPYHFLGPFLKENDLHHHVYLGLWWGGRLIGFMNFHFRERTAIKPAKHHLYQSIANQIAVVVANILANEEITQREREKGLLLSLSEDMATIRDRAGLHRVLSERIKPITGFEDAALLTFFDDYQFMRPLIDMTTEAGRQHPRYSSLFRRLTPVIGSMVQTLLNQPGAPVVWGEAVLHRYTTHPPVLMLLEMGVRATVALPLIYAGELMGTLLLYYREPVHVTPALLTLGKSVGEQMAVAVANVLANEDIAGRETDKAMQAAVSEVLAGNRNWPALLTQLATTIDRYVPTTVLGFVLDDTDTDPARAYEVLKQSDGTWQVSTGERFRQHHKLTPDQYAQLRESRQQAFRVPNVQVGEAFDQFCQTNRLSGLMRSEYGLRSALHLPVALPHGGRALIFLGAKQGWAFTDEDLDRLVRLQPSLALMLDNFLAFLENDALKQKLEAEKTYLQTEIKANYNFEEIIGHSPALHDIFKRLVQVAPTDSTVLILGETGTGKELIARAIHNLSNRKERVLVKLNCAALPPQLIESELFGHERGAFTGAIEKRVGKFEVAHGGTIFLDEVGELPLDLQVKLLRVLQEGEVERLGSNKPLRTDVRVIAATNRDLSVEVAEGRFRADLYFRLNVFPLTLPPLRQRRDDIVLLAGHFVQKFAKRMHKTIKSIANVAMQELLAYPWPGNVRELEHVIERAVIMSSGPTLELAGPLQALRSPAVETEPDRVRTLAETEAEAITRALTFTQGRIRGKGGAAELLQIEPNTLDGRMRKLGLLKKNFPKQG